MPVTEELVTRTLDRLARWRIKPTISVSDLANTLIERDPDTFEELPQSELTALAKELLARMGGSAPPPRVQASGAGGSGRGTGGRSLRPDVVPAAPFRFVTLPDQVNAPVPKPRLDRPLPDGFTASIDVEWASETPLLVGVQGPRTNPNVDPVVEPMKIGGRYAIPGATLRGMLRAAMEILAHGRLGAANLHHQYGLRDFDHPRYGEEDAYPVARVSEVKAGWLSWREGPTGHVWQIAPVNSWSHIDIDELINSNFVSVDPGTSRTTWIDQKLRSKYAAADMMRPGSAEYDFRKTVPVSAPRLSGPEKYARLVSKLGGDRTGVLVFSGRLPDPNAKASKRYEYVFDDTSGEPIDLDPDVVKLFVRLNSKPSKKALTPDGSWRELSPTFEGGGRIPVFYVGDLASQNRGFFFGLTRLFKVPHVRSVRKILEQTQAAHLPSAKIKDGVVSDYDPDFVEALFGYVVEPEDLGLKDVRVDPSIVSLKGRISFSPAFLNPGQDPARSELTAILLAPRPSFAPFYLKARGEKDYSSTQPPSLAGRKRYLARTKGGNHRTVLEAMRAMAARQKANLGGANTSQIESRLSFLISDRGSELRFRSRIDLHNVSAAELGAVLFALTHGGDPAKPYRHMIGRAKPFGSGQLRVTTARLSVTANAGTSDKIAEPKKEEIVSADGGAGFCPAGGETVERNASHRPFIEAFVETMRKVTAKSYPDVPAVREFLGASEPAVVATLNQSSLDYLSLNSYSAIRKAVKTSGKDGPAAQIGPDPQRILPAPKTGKIFWT